VRPIAITHELGADQTHVQLVDEGVWLEGMIRALVVKEARGDLLKLRMDNGEQLVARVLVPLPPIGEPARDLIGERRDLRHGRRIIPAGAIFALP